MEKYHAHIYYDSESRNDASLVRDLAITALPIEKISGLIDKCVGPHTSPMFNFTFLHEEMEFIREWLQQHRGELSVLIHPLSGNELNAHTERAIWLGEKLAIKEAALTD